MKLVLVGAGGYGQTYLELLKQMGRFGELAGVVDPYVTGSSYYARIRQAGIPVYDTLEAYFAGHTADLVILSSPINLHEPQAITALRHGAHVLCEKPLTATLQQAAHIEEERTRAGKTLGVAFQWSFSPTLQKLKANIQAGVYGKPLCLKTYIAWPRNDAYYDTSVWKGRVRGQDGEWILDSIASNATAHYLHNIFFMLGETRDTARMPTRIRGSLYRARPIESFDTCFLQGEFEDGCEFFYLASHVSDGVQSPKMEYRFEKAMLTMESNESEIYVRWNDGREEVYPAPAVGPEAGEKLIQMERAIQAGETPACHVGTITPHLAVCNAMFDYFPIHNFPADMIRATDAGVEVPSLTDALKRCFLAEALPDALDYAWAQPAAQVEMADVREFTGRLV